MRRDWLEVGDICIFGSIKYFIHISPAMGSVITTFTSRVPARVWVQCYRGSLSQVTLLLVLVPQKSVIIHGLALWPVPIQFIHLSGGNRRVQKIRNSKANSLQNHLPAPLLFWTPCFPSWSGGGGRGTQVHPLLWVPAHGPCSSG